MIVDCSAGSLESLGAGSTAPGGLGRELIARQAIHPYVDRIHMMSQCLLDVYSNLSRPSYRRPVPQTIPRQTLHLEDDY